MILVTHFAYCHQYKGYWRSCPLGWSYFTVMPEFAKSAGATEDLKAADPMKWVGLLNACKAQAEEIVKYELIYA